MMPTIPENLNLEAAIAGSPEFYKTYLRKIPDGDIFQMLDAQIREVQELFLSLPEDRQEYRYAEGKWTPKELLGHLIDTERVFQYRVLRFGRRDATPLPGFDEDHYVPAGHFNARTLDDLLDEFVLVRMSSHRLYTSLAPEAYALGGEASGKHITVATLIWITAGHVLHHCDVLRERYMG